MALRATLPAVGSSVVSILWRNPALARTVLAFAAFNLADWARWLAILVGGGRGQARGGRLTAADRRAEAGAAPSVEPHPPGS